MKKISLIVAIALISTGFYWNSKQVVQDDSSFMAVVDSEQDRSVASTTTSNRVLMKKETSKVTNQKSRKYNIPFGKDRVVNQNNNFRKSKLSGTSMSTQVFWLKGQKLNIAKGYRAIKKEQYLRSMGRKISSVNKHIIVKGTAGLPVVQDPIKKIKGIATGHIIVKAKPDTDLRELARTYKLSVHHTVPHLNIISFIPEDKEKLLETSVKLSQSDLLESVKLDISYGGPRAK